MKRIFLLFILMGTSANAATMCAPDLSTCESCTRISYDGGYWTAQCCGVQVSGIGFEAQFPSEHKQSQPLSLLGGRNVNDGRYIACLMLSPVTAKYYHMAILTHGMFASAGELCGRYFNPRCALVECNLPIVEDDNWTDPL